MYMLVIVKTFSRELDFDESLEMRYNGAQLYIKGKARMKQVKRAN